MTDTAAGAPARATAVESLAGQLVRLRRATETLKSRHAVTADLDLDRAAVSVLFVTVQHGAQRSTDLAKALCLDPSTMSRHVAALSKQGFVQRVPDPNDGRAHLVEATERGQEFHGRLVERRNALIYDLLAEWDDDDIETLAVLLGRLNDTLLDAPHDSPPREGVR